MNLNKKILASKKKILLRKIFIIRKYPEFFENISKYIYIFELDLKLNLNNSILLNDI